MLTYAGMCDRERHTKDTERDVKNEQKFSMELQFYLRNRRE